MRIAQVAPLTEAVPPKLYGGTERVVHWLTEELVALGHDVTLFASGDSRTSAKLDATWPKALRLDGSVVVSKEQRLRQQQKTTQPPDISRVLAWKSAMSPAERRRYEAVAGPLLLQVGYEVDSGQGPVGNSSVSVTGSGPPAA
jgi:hypothetical protein